MKVSVALASHNGEAFIGRQLQSLVDQTRPVDQLVIADDASCDRTLEVARAFFDETRIDGTILRNETGSPLRPPKNFERAMMRCTGDLVLCCDQDDEWDATKVSAVCAAFAEDPGLACFLNNTRFCDGDLRPTGSDKLGQIRRAGLPDHSFVMGCCAAFRKSLLEIALPIPDEITHDGWVVGLADLLDLTRRSTEILQSYRIHQGNVSKGFFINASGRAGRRGMALSKLRAALSGFASNHALLRELVFVCAAEERLITRRQQILAAYPDADPDSALVRIRERRARLDFRKSVRLASAGRRLALIGKGFRDGHYKGRGGMVNAVKDAMVRMAPTEQFRLWPR